jgi:hypothetical protein
MWIPVQKGALSWAGAGIDLRSNAPSSDDRDENPGRQVPDHPTGVRVMVLQLTLILC